MDKDDLGKIPIRQDITILSADEPKKPIGWTVHIMTDEEIAQENSKKNLKKLKKEREQDPKETSTYGEMSFPVLEKLWGTKWNAAAYNFIRCLRPSCVRVIKHNEHETLDCFTWRVTVRLDERKNIIDIKQEVDVGLVGFRNGQDARNYYEKNYSALENAQSHCIINTKAIKKLRLKK